MNDFGKAQLLVVVCKYSYYLAVACKRARKVEIQLAVIIVMGGLCSRRSTVDNAPGGSFPHVNGHLDGGSGLVFQSRALPARISDNPAPPLAGDNVDKQLRQPFTFPERNPVQCVTDPADINDGIPRLSRVLSNKSRSTKPKQAAVAKVTIYSLVSSVS